MNDRCNVEHDVAPGGKLELRLNGEGLIKSSGRDARYWQREQQAQRQEIGGDLAVSEARQGGQLSGGHTAGGG